MDDFVFENGKKYFYGGFIDDVQGDISIKAMDKILDLIEEYEALVKGEKA